MLLTVLDLFSGIGGFTLGLEKAGFETIAFCENNEFSQKVLTKEVLILFQYIHKNVHDTEIVSITFFQN